MPAFEQVVIVGVGLLGGSIGLAVKERQVAGEVIGIGRNQARLDEAIRREIIDRATTDLRAGVQQADLVVVCTPVELVSETAKDVLRAAPANCLVTDVGSTKQAIVDALSDWAMQFVGSHPLAGDHRSGAEFARGGLLEGKMVVVTPTPQTNPTTEERIGGFWSALGANVVTLAADEHDAAVAVTSHLPHAVASALAATMPKSMLPLAATGFADTTRVAAADPQLWRQIFLTNREQVLAAIDDFDHHLAALRDALAAGDEQQLEQLLAEGKQIRDALGN